ncbi:MAG: FAD-dependent tricarballylate dehydrogenase TcuA [Candidatus Micrarchaeota archaeon]|nr:FAD-dependent tricarballylate dehydrogenase TcuA [Candidatus Micrarchaeota archaeon]
MDIHASRQAAQGIGRGMDSDVIVVGAGNAALTAALSAAESRADILVLEKAPMHERGGNTAMTAGIFRHAHDGKQDIIRLVDGMSQKDWNGIEIHPYPAKELYDDVMKLSNGKADPVLSKVWTDNSYETMLWMKEGLGIKFAFTDFFTQTASAIKEFMGPEVIKAKDGGPGLSSALFSKSERSKNVTIQYDTKVESLIMESGSVIGVRANAGGKTIEVKAKSVVLGSGGFEASRELRSRFLGGAWERAKVRGTRHNTGEALLAAIEAGAGIYGDVSGCHATQIDSRAPDYGNIEITDKTSRYSWPYGILVNKEGKRFVDEGEDFAPIAYAKVGRMIVRQSDAIAYQVFDQRTVGLLEKEYGTMAPITVQSFAQLGEKVDIDAVQLGKTVEEFNRSVDGARAFNPRIKDGRGTRGIRPGKTNWAQVLDKPPFVVYPVTCGITFTYGGLRINEKAQVLDRHGSTIPGLYATGEITGGFFYSSYPRGSGLTRGAVFGRIAGAEAASSAGF